jgi:RHS repeat-associated protein
MMTLQSFLSSIILQATRLVMSVVMLCTVLPLIASTSAHAAKKTVHFYNDISGSPQLAVDADSGQVLWKETYKPYGERINNAPASSTGKGKNELYFHGKQQEALNGGVTVQYFGARYYDPSIGRFLGVDPIHFSESSVHSFNRFAYGNNNPYKFRDPDGRSPESPLMDTVVGDPQSVMVARGMMYFGEALTLAVPAAQLVRGGVALYRGMRGAEAAVAAGEATAQAAPKIGSAGGEGAGKKFADKIKDAARDESGNTCVFCKAETPRTPGPTQSNIDHAIPKSRGGNNTLENAQNTCRTCNLDKGTSTTGEYLQRLYEAAK